MYSYRYNERLRSLFATKCPHPPVLVTQHACVSVRGSHATTQDIYSRGDLAIRKGTARLLKRNEDSFAKTKAAREADELAKPWAPYRSLACMYLYSIIDTKGV